MTDVEIHEMFNAQDKRIKILESKLTLVMELNKKLMDFSVAMPPAPVEEGKKPHPKGFGPDPNFVAPTPTPESVTLNEHTVQWPKGRQW
jgi:hypothetical protein